MKLKNFSKSAVLAAVLMLTVCFTVSAAEKIEITTSVKNDAAEYTGNPFDEKITLDNGEYRLAGFKLVKTESKIPKPEIRNVVFPIGADSVNPGDKIHTPDGKQTVKSVEMIEVPQKNRHMAAEKSVDYPLMTEKPTAPAEAIAAVTDELTEKEVSAAIPFERLVEFEPYSWHNDFSVTMTIRNYDASYYVFEGERVEYNDEQPDIINHREALYQYFGLSPEHYRFDRAEYSSAAYNDENGILCRDVLISGARYAARYRARYKGNVPLPDTTVLQMRAFYEIPNPSAKTEYVHHFKAEYVPIEPAKLNIPMAAAASLTLAVCGVFFGILLIRSKNIRLYDDRGKLLYAGYIKGKIADLSKIRRDEHFRITVKISKGYCKRHLQETVRLIGNGEVIREVTVAEPQETVITL